MRNKSPRDGVKVKFREWDCVLKELRYTNGRTALTLLDAQTRDSVACATVNLPDRALGPNEVFIKDWSENEGMLTALEAAGVVRPTGEMVQSGFVAIPKCELLIPERRHEATRTKNSPEKQTEGRTGRDVGLER
ncbi:MAG: hypothetical protein WCI73_00055 [Phycisphaerae bacterium]